MPSLSHPVSLCAPCPVLRRRAKKLPQDILAQGFRTQDFDLGAVFQDVEDELAVVGIGDFEQVVCALEPALLPRVPGLLRHPAGAFGG